MASLTESLAQLLTAADEEISDYSEATANVTSLKAQIDGKRQELASLTSELDAVTGTQSTERAEAITAVRAIITELENLIASLQPASA